MPLFAQNYETVLNVPKAQLQSRLEIKKKKKGEEKCERMREKCNSSSASNTLLVSPTAVLTLRQNFAAMLKLKKKIKQTKLLRQLTIIKLKKLETGNYSSGLTETIPMRRVW